MCAYVWEGLSQHVLAIDLADLVKDIPHLSLFKHHKAQSSIMRHAMQGTVSTGDDLFAAVIPANQSTSERFKWPNSGVMGKMECARPLLNYLYPLTDMQINTRASALAEFTQEGAGKKTTPQQQPTHSGRVFSRAHTLSPLLWPITIKLLCRLFFLFFSTSFRIHASNLTGHQAW